MLVSYTEMSSALDADRLLAEARQMSGLTDFGDERFIFALRRMTEHECDRRAKRRNLRKRKIDEDNFSSQNHDAEIGMDADQADRHQKRGPEELDDIDHRLAAAFVKAATFTSNSEI